MYAESLSFDPTSHQDEGIEEKGLLQNHSTTCATNFSMGVELQQQQQLNLEMVKFHSTLNTNIVPTENNLIQEFEHEHNNNTVLSYGQANWEEMGFNPYNHQQGHEQHQISNFPISTLITNNPSNTSLGYWVGFPRTELASTSTNLFYDPQLNMPVNLCTPQPTLFKELFQLSPHGSYGLGSSGTGSFFSHGVAEEEVTGALYHDAGSFDINSAAKKKEGKDIKHHTSEKQRRVHFSDKFQALRALIPNPSKNDRATIIADAIGYIDMLKSKVNELKNEVEKKERVKRQRTEDDGSCGFNTVMAEAAENNVNIRSSWLQKKSKNTEVDVRIMDDEVTVKLVQHHKRMNCLLFVSKAFDEFQLDLHHVSGGLIGDHYSYLFNSKICEGSTVYASAIANKVIEVLDKEYSAIVPSCNH
ncbi:PREDICTED: transcription factor bHLH91-like [Nicotiana attenuata]|uniref:Transcription factor bhlh91 n=1 Tax=Nicotiana attenuata TaxID=49451 RepID=A0A314KXC4_NICAT|nr:PREDICTED: transcription factor bHLH91-like [Nicotiana attenuata]OIT34161.1 transcription factor bhlh91 [Nicotiana attenuata]